MSFTFDQLLDRYAELLITYCLEIKQKDRLLIKSTLLAEPLVKRLYSKCLEAGGHPHLSLSFSEQNEVYMERATDHQLNYVSPFFTHAMEEFEAYLVVRAPYNLAEGNGRYTEKNKVRSKAMEAVNETYFKRTGTKALKRSLCQFPTNAAAQYAGMTLSEYREFIFGACQLYSPDPGKAWLQVRERQQSIVDKLNACATIRYVNEKTDLSFSTKGRIWINSDGQTNMPSGEVFTSPVEDSVKGHIYFDLPTVYRGKVVKGVRFEVKDGIIQSWQAEQGQQFLDEIMEIEGTRRFGEAAIGTNYNITQTTGNILFDEKMGGTIHMAIGQSYPQTGGKNKSTVHWDMIADMKHGGQIYADSKLIYENGKFI